jgi:hypothetical protein
MRSWCGRRSAVGTLRSLVTLALRLACVCVWQSRGREYAGARMRQPFAVRRVPSGTRSRGPSRNSLHSLRSLRSNNRDESDHDARSRARPRALRSSAPHMSLPAHTHPRLCRHHRAFRRTPRALLRGGRYPLGAICGAARSAAPGSARAARFVHLTRRDCPSEANAVSAASFAARPRREHRSGVGAQRRPPQYEPPTGTARRAARKANRRPTC